MTPHDHASADLRPAPGRLRDRDGPRPGRTAARGRHQQAEALGPVGACCPAAAAHPDAAYDELVALTGRPPALDTRVAHALAEIMHPGDGAPRGAVAAEVGLSAPRLRALVREAVGTSLAVLRQWARPRDAVAALPGASPAAAYAGFADQAHLTRTSRKLIGRTPGSLPSARRATGFGSGP
ncbi:helix-turn-helix domain-containing protein [Streptomyces sp. NPDC059679]|uniref:helix-turn-helix domain-containing protein n=1 Tax=Streptomyces sp. NPDC059679 TaxID=3346903 RepID=UPI00368A7DC0